MILRHPIQQRRRQQQRLITKTTNEFLGHPRSLLTPADDTNYPTATVGAVTRFDSILVGCLASCVFRSGYSATVLRVVSVPLVWLAALAVIGWLVATAGPGAVYDGRTILFCVAAAILLLAALDSRRAPGWLLALPPFIFFGRISYAVYLWHRPILLWLERSHVVSHLGNTAGKIVAILLTVSVATGSYYLIEQRFLRRKWKIARVVSHDLPLAQAEHLASTPGTR